MVHISTENGLSVLTKGLSFVPTPTITFKQDTNKSWNKLKTRMLIQYFFRINIHDNPLNFKRKSSWTPPPSDNPTLTNFFTRAEQGFISVTISQRKTYSNLPSQDKSALNNLKNNQSIVIKPCDKGGGICMMNTRDYLTKIYTPTRPQYIQTTQLQPNKCNSQRYMHSHRIYTFPTHNWQSQQKIFNTS